jgi:hypothetical protein
MTVLRLDLDFSARERGIIACSLVAGFVAGIWFGVVNVPPEALDVPKDYADGYVQAVYNPVTSGQIFLTFALPLVAIYYAYHTPFDGTEEVTGEE